jgi:Peptidase family M28
MAWIQTVVDRGIRRPGSDANRWTQQWAAATLAGFGLRDVALEAVDLPAWEPRSAALRAWPTDRPAAAVEFTGFPLPYTAATEGVEADLVRGGDIGQRGRIVVDEVSFLDVPQAWLREAATSVYDPERAFDHLVQTLPFDWRLDTVADTAVDAGAAGFVGTLTGVPWQTRDYYVPYDAKPRPLPALWLSGADGHRLAALMADGPVRGRLTVDAHTRPARDHNVVGVLPGRSPYWIVVASHHDGPWASAVEDATGIALVLAQAKLWSSVPAEERPHNLLFLLTAGHMAGAAGTRAFIDAHRDLLDNVVLQVHLEHAARRCVVADGTLVPTDDPENRWWFTTPVACLETAVADAIAAERLRRSLVLRPDTFGAMPPTDGAYFHAAGVPVLHFLSAPPYLFDPCDTVDKVDEAGLAPLTGAVARVIMDSRHWNPATLRI